MRVTHELDWPQIASQEHGGRLHRTDRKVKQWKVGLSTSTENISELFLIRMLTQSIEQDKVKDGGCHISSHF